MTNHPIIARAKNIGQKGNLISLSARGGYDPQVSIEYENKNFDSKNYYSSLISKVKQPIYTSQYITAGYEYGSGILSEPRPQDSDLRLALHRN
jgi:hypothetical protein